MLKVGQVWTAHGPVSNWDKTYPVWSVVIIGWCDGVWLAVPNLETSEDYMPVWRIAANGRVLNDFLPGVRLTDQSRARSHICDPYAGFEGGEYPR